jgi:hypothetical protein
MSKAFPTIVSTRRDGESPVTQSLLQDFHDRDESLISQPIDTRFAEKTVNAAGFTEMFRLNLFLPKCVGTADGAVTLVFVFEAKANAVGNLCRIRTKLGAGGTYVETADINAAAYARFALTISAADVAAAADSEVELIVEGRYTGTAGAVFIRCEWCASRVERAT